MVSSGAGKSGPEKVCNPFEPQTGEFRAWVVRAAFRANSERTPEFRPNSGQIPSKFQANSKQACQTLYFPVILCKEPPWLADTLVLGLSRPCAELSTPDLGVNERSLRGPAGAGSKGNKRCSFQSGTSLTRRAPKGRQQMGETGFCKRSAVSCKIYGLVPKPFDFQSQSNISKNQRESAKSATVVLFLP